VRAVSGQRRADGDRQLRRGVHALPAGASRRGGHVRRLRIARVDRVRSGGESAARPESPAADAARTRRARVIDRATSYQGPATSSPSHQPPATSKIPALMNPAAPWLAHYDKGVPATLAPYPNRTLLDYV